MSTSRIHARGPVGIQVLAAMMMMVNSDDDDGDDLLCLHAQTLTCERLSSLCAGPHVDEVGAHVFCGVRCHMGVGFGIAVLLPGIEMNVL